MNYLLRKFYWSLPLGLRLYLTTYLVVSTVGFLSAYAHHPRFYDWLGLIPASVYKGEIWRVVTYSFLPANSGDWLFGAIWLAMLMSLLTRVWTSHGFWAYCLFGALGTAMPFLIFRASSIGIMVGSGGVIFALLVAWAWHFRYDRIMLLGVGEMSVLQAATASWIICSLVIFFSCGGWFVMLATWCGGLFGWLALFVRYKLILHQTPQAYRSERGARLEL